MMQSKLQVIRQRQQRVREELKRFDDTTALEAKQDREFGEYLSQVRQKLGITQYAVAKNAQISERRYQALENGQPLRSVTKSECVSIAAALGVNKSDLFNIAIGNNHFIY